MIIIAKCLSSLDFKYKRNKMQNELFVYIMPNFKCQ